jgi:hypothetical protein
MTSHYQKPDIELKNKQIMPGVENVDRRDATGFQGIRKMLGRDLTPQKIAARVTCVF